MNQVEIDVSELPDLEQPTGIFGSIGKTQSSDDSVIILMAYIFEIDPPTGP